MRFSIITPTFNRRSIVSRSIDSSLAFIHSVADSEVVVVDDASRDGTSDEIRQRYRAELDNGFLKLVERQQNGGSTIAKGDGARSARGHWLIFLDSDDELLKEASMAIPPFIDAHPNAPVFLFRCVDQDDLLIGPKVSPRALTFSQLLNDGTPGECLPVILRTAFLQFPSDGDAIAFEFMSTLRIVRAHGPAMLSDAVARRYHMDGADRLTSRSGNLRRARQHARGFNRMLSEFGSMMSLTKRMQIRLRVICYNLIAACTPHHRQSR